MEYPPNDFVTELMTGEREVEKPIIRDKTGVGQAFEQFLKDCDLKFTKLKK